MIGGTIRRNTPIGCGESNDASTSLDDEYVELASDRTFPRSAIMGRDSKVLC